MEAADMELLRDYAQNHSEQAFRTLVERHVDMVFAVALRQTENTQLAEEVTQTVFVVLAEKAASIPKGTILTGWLFRATRFAASNVRRAEARREHWEQKAAQMEPQPPSESELDQIAPVLNQALEQLPELDRAAILLRFFESKSMEEVGRSLGTTEGAAKMRLSRAMERLRVIFRQRGVVVPAAVLLGVLSAQTAHAAPAGLASSVVACALLKQTATSTLPLVKGTLIFMAKTKANKLAIAALALLLGGTAAVVVQQSLQRKSAPQNETSLRQRNPAMAESKAVVTASGPATNQPGKILVFRSVPSWNRNPDFEDALAALGMEFEVRAPEEMGNTDLSRHPVIVIPGSQGRTEFYPAYTANAARFDGYVTNGGTLVLELNGAENDAIPLPRGVSMVSHGARDNAILLPDHPVFSSFGQKTIHANYASHGFLSGVPNDAIVLAVESANEEAELDKPTFIEYSYGAGRVIAACQCFHDQDRSGRGILMETVLNYASEKKWFSPKPGN
jgi:RNA polymerase sigma factor (sigma-70 family)